MTASSFRRQGKRSTAPKHNRRPIGLKRFEKAASLVLVALMLLMVLATAGHGIAHLGHDHDVHTCPVCQAICGYEKLLAGLLLLSLALLLKPVKRQAGFSCLAHLPLLPSLTPVFLKVKLSN